MRLELDMACQFNIGLDYSIQGSTFLQLQTMILSHWKAWIGN